MKKIFFAMCLLAAAGQSFAQQKTRTGFNGFSLTSPLQISAGEDKNFLIDRTTLNEQLFYSSLSPTVQRFTPLATPKQHDDKVLLLTGPTMSFLSDSPRREFAISYKPEFELFKHNTDQNSWNHDANASFTHYLTRKTQVVVGDVFRSSKDASRTLQNVFLLLPRSRFSENAFRAAVSHDRSERTNFTVRFDNTYTKFGQVDPFQIRVLDTIGNSISFVGTRMLDHNQRLRLTYSIFRATPIDKHGEGDSAVDSDRSGMGRPAHSVSGEYKTSFNSSTIAELSGGMVNTEVGNNFVFGLSGDRRFGEIWVGGGYSRSMSFYAGGPRVVVSGVKSTDFFEVAQFRVRGQPLRRVGIDFTVIGARGVSGLVANASKSLMGRARVDYRWTDRMTSFVNFETYQQNRNEYVNAPLSRNRFFIGLEFSLADEANQRTNRLNRDAEYVALTEQGRHREPK